MLYRLYRRDPVVKGAWYYTLKCKGCGKLIYVLDDKSDGRSPAKIAGDGQLSVPCGRCFYDDLYDSDDLEVIQSKEELGGRRPTRVQPSKSSRKPIMRAYSKARATFGVGYIEDRPKAAAIVARIITSWTDIEVQCTRLLAELMGTNIPAAAAVFGSLRSSRAQHDALAAAAEAVLEPHDFVLFQAHMKRRASLEKERNDLAHGCFGVSDLISEGVVWVSQGDFLAFTAARTSGSDSDALEQFRKKQFVYELGTLERIAQEIEEFYHQLGFFTGYLFARAGGPSGAVFRSMRYRELCEQPHIQKILNDPKFRKEI